MLSKQNRLTKRGSFAFVYRKGSVIHGDFLVLHYVKATGGVKIGFSVSNKIGNAVVRNKLKRQLRAIVRNYLGQLLPCQAVIVTKKNIVEADFDAMEKETVKLLTKSELLGNRSTQ